MRFNLNGDWSSMGVAYEQFRFDRGLRPAMSLNKNESLTYNFGAVELKSDLNETESASLLGQHFSYAPPAGHAPLLAAYLSEHNLLRTCLPDAVEILFSVVKIRTCTSLGNASNNQRGNSDRSQAGLLERETANIPSSNRYFSSSPGCSASRSTGQYAPETAFVDDEMTDAMVYRYLSHVRFKYYVSYEFDLIDLDLSNRFIRFTLSAYLPEWMYTLCFVRSSVFGPFNCVLDIHPE